jgi:hypothetical protein
VGTGKGSSGTAFATLAASRFAPHLGKSLISEHPVSSAMTSAAVVIGRKTA